MNVISRVPLLNRGLQKWMTSFLLFVLATTHTLAQSLDCNLIDKTPFVNDASGTFSVEKSSTSTGLAGWTYANRAINKTNNTLSQASIGSVVLGGTVTYTVTTTAGTVFDPGYFVGFHLQSADVVSGSTITISTLLDGQVQESTSNTNVLLSINAPVDAGLLTTKRFDAIRLHCAAGGVTFNISVFYPFIQKFCSINDLNSSAYCNTPTFLTAPEFPVATEVASALIAGVDNPNYAIDDDPATAATLVTTLGGAELTVKNLLDTLQFPNGAFVGFDIENSSLINLNLLSGMSIKLYLGDEEVESTAGADLLSLNLLQSGRQKLGLVTKKAFNKIKIVNGAVLNLSGGIKIYGAVVQPFCLGGPINCDTKANTVTALSAPNYPVVTEVNAALLAGVEGANNAISGGNDYATLSATLGGASLAVKNILEEYEYPNGAFVGFEIEQSQLLDVSLINALRISVYLDDQEVDQSSVGDLLSVGLLTNGRQKVGFVTKEKFNKIKITTVSVLELSSGIKVYNAFIQPFCEADPAACNNIVAMTAPEYPVFVNYRRTAAPGLINGISNFTGLDNVLDANATEPATLFQAVSVINPMTYSVKKGGAPFNGGEYVGFEIQNDAILDVSLLSGITITTYNADGIVDNYGAGGLAVSVSLVQDNGRQTIGVVTKEGRPFDEVQISFVKVLDVSLGEVKIYRFVAEQYCPVDLTCNSQIPVSRSVLPAVIEARRTGFSSVACVACDIQNVIALTTSDPDDFTTIQVPVQLDLGPSAGVSVRTPKTVYPAGTMAGFKIKSYSTLVDVELFPSLTIETYLNGQKVESQSGRNLIDLTALLRLLGPGPGVFYAGFMTSAPFDEIRLRVGSLLSLNVLNKIDVYHAFVNTTTSVSEDGTLMCLTTNPDMNVAYINQQVTGDVSTNDYNGSSLPVTYGTPEAAATNPVGGTMNMNPDGTYTFIATQTGTYTYDIPVCVGTQTGDECSKERLTVSVVDPARVDNTPIVNTDIVAINGADNTPGSVLVNVKGNDGPGNTNGQLGAPSVTTPSSDITGSATVDGQNVRYTPEAGYYGVNSFNYSVTETPSNLSGSAPVLVRVLPAGTSYVAASDDYNLVSSVSTLSVSAANGVLANDYNSKGGQLTATLGAANARVSASNDAGTINIASDGGYTFTPTSGFVGTTSFPYTACNADGVCSMATLYISIYNASALPVKLASFTASEEGRVAILKWSTTEEINTSHFEVERSADGKRWTSIGSMKASANTTSLTTYSFTDKAPFAGVNYYRLNMVDKDGSSSRSEIRSLTFAHVAGVTVYPNPVADQLFIDSASEIKEVKLYSAAGQLLFKAGNAAKFDISHLPTGIYTLTVTEANGKTTSRKILKK